MADLLSSFVDNFYSQLKRLSEARMSPFASYGYYCQCKKNLAKEYWFFSRNNNTYNNYSLELNQLSDLLETGIEKDVVIEAIAYLIALMPIEKKAEYVNALYFSELFRPISKDIINITSTHGLLIDSVSDRELVLCKMLGFVSSEALTIEIHEQFPWLAALNSLPDDQLLKVFTDLFDDGLLETRVMSLFLLMLEQSQLNLVCNFASNILSADDSFALLIRSGMVKYAPLVNSVLVESESSPTLVKEMRNVFGSYLDELVSFDTQLSAWQGDQDALEGFQKEFAVNWPKHEDDLAGQRLINGFSLSSAISLADKEAFNVSSFLLLAFFEKYQSVQHVEKELGAV